MAWGAQLAGLVFDATKNTAAGVALGYANDAQNLRNYVASAHLPNCNQTYNGTITSTVPSGQPGLVIQNGSAYIGGDTSVAGNLGVGGDITASKLKATQGISAYGDQITIGNADLETYPRRHHHRRWCYRWRGHRRHSSHDGTQGRRRHRQRRECEQGQ